MTGLIKSFGEAIEEYSSYRLIATLETLIGTSLENFCNP
ncbi:hypothetical protein C789_1442 [Microcystis aeruginosa FACHB-905 = DIANCHI905]|uniref:Uncharacterized protein n=1 Tax=Microcystis aeruginosa PCC 7806SL TaxID=1903187 RepID=A0AB33BYZ7_MICA7|nr:hypothetical protein BH695_2627 [Microcystis aeruginosa PCC 7806SL]ELS48751.1 hypothetical protein C789_1442 [Microcystis aeruginosa FACHB-905 = DIANCHI905]